jgi:hypothetical protein
MLTMIKKQKDRSIGLPFGYLVTKICLQFVFYIPDSEPRERDPDTFHRHTLTKSATQIRFVGQVATGVPPLAQPDPQAASSSHDQSTTEGLLLELVDDVHALRCEVSAMSIRVELA